MRTRTVPTVTTVLMLLLLPGAGSAAGRPASLCAARESVVMTCRAGPDLASVCASRAASGELAYAQYRFGRPGRPAIAIPPRQPFDLSRVRGQMTTGTHGGWEGLSFQDGDVVYTVEHTWYLQGKDDVDITVARGGQALKNFGCRPLFTGGGRDGEGLRGFIAASHLEALEPGPEAQ